MCEEIIHREPTSWIGFFIENAKAVSILAQRESKLRTEEEVYKNWYLVTTKRLREGEKK